MPNRFVTWWRRVWSNPTPFTLHKDPVVMGETSYDLGLNDTEEFQRLQDKLADIQTDLDEANRQLKLLRQWYDEFEDLTDWMHLQGFWNGDDVDEKNPMQTYKNGLTRFLNVIS